MDSNTERLRQKMRSAIEQKDFRTLFMEGGCHIYALVLHEQLGLPLFYSAPPGSTECRHAFVMKDGFCFDYEGLKPLAEVAKAFAEWPDVPPRVTTIEFLKGVIKTKDLGDELEWQMFEIARLEFTRRRKLYPADTSTGADGKIDGWEFRRLLL